jgi:uncharacterized membrane protein
MTSQPTTGNGALSLKSWTLIVWGLYLASFFSLAITQIIGLIIAYVKRSDAAGTPFEFHMIYAMRTFWIGLGIGIIGLILSVVGIGVLVLIGLVIWQLYRIIRGLIRAADGQPIENPLSWL